jgi:hypothetical protein
VLRVVSTASLSPWLAIAIVWLQDDPDVIPSVLNCVAAGKDDSVSALALQPVLAIIDQLLEYGECTNANSHRQAKFSCIE